jgi:hypothetical protein
MEEPRSRLEPQKRRDHGGSPFLVVDLVKDPGSLTFASLRLCVRLEDPGQQPGPLMDADGWRGELFAVGRFRLNRSQRRGLL